MPTTKSLLKSQKSKPRKIEIAAKQQQKTSLYQNASTTMIKNQRIAHEIKMANIR